MNLDIPADLREFVKSAVTSGHFRDEGEVVGEALRLLRHREELRLALNTGLAQLESGQCSEYDKSGLKSKFETIKLAARAQLNREPPTP